MGRRIAGAAACWGGRSLGRRLVGPADRWGGGSLGRRLPGSGGRIGRFRRVGHVGRVGRAGVARRSGGSGGSVRVGGSGYVNGEHRGTLPTDGSPSPRDGNPFSGGWGPPFTNRWSPFYQGFANPLPTDGNPLPEGWEPLCLWVATDEYEHFQRERYPTCHRWSHESRKCGWGPNASPTHEGEK